MECGRKAVRVKAPVHPHLMSTREGGAATRFYIEFRSDFRQILARFLEGNLPDFILNSDQIVSNMSRIFRGGKLFYRITTQQP